MGKFRRYSRFSPDDCVIRKRTNFVRLEHQRNFECLLFCIFYSHSYRFCGISALKWFRINKWVRKWVKLWKVSWKSRRNWRVSSLSKRQPTISVWVVANAPSELISSCHLLFCPLRLHFPKEGTNSDWENCRVDLHTLDKAVLQGYVCKPICWWSVDIQISGKEHIPKKGATILVCAPHANQFVDAMIVSSQMPRKVCCGNERRDALGRFTLLEQHQVLRFQWLERSWNWWTVSFPWIVQTTLPKSSRARWSCKERKWLYVESEMIIHRVSTLTSQPWIHSRPPYWYRIWRKRSMNIDW